MRLLKGYKAEEEVNDFVRRSKNAIRHKALGDPEKGIPPRVIGNGTRMYAYKYVLNSKGVRETLEPNYDIVWVDGKGVKWTEVRVVVFIFRCVRRRIPLRHICTRLNKLGIPAPCISMGRKYGIRGKSAEKPLWQVAVISHMLRNTTYSGKVVVNAHRSVKVPGMKSSRRIKNPVEEHIIVPVPAIISVEFHEEVLKNLALNQKYSLRNNKQGVLTLLRAGLAKCGNCGRTASPRRMNYTRANKGQKEYIYYRCLTEATSSPYKCTGCSINATIIDNAAWEKAIEIINNPSIVDEALERKRTEDPTASRRKQIKKELTKLTTERDNLQATLLRLIQERKLDRNTEDVLTNRLKEIERLQHQYNSELSDDEKMHREWERAQRELQKFHKRCAVMRDKLNDPAYKPSYGEKRDLIEFFGISAIIWEQGHSPRFKIEAKFPDIMLQLSQK